MKKQINDLPLKMQTGENCIGETANELLNLYSVSNCLHENTYPIDRFGNSKCHDCGKFISHNDC